MAMEANTTVAAAMRPSMDIITMDTTIATADRTAVKRMASTQVNITTLTPAGIPLNTTKGIPLDIPQSMVVGILPDIPLPHRTTKSTSNL
jgi:hypothetical protein